MTRVLIFFFVFIVSLPLFADKNSHGELSDNDMSLLNLLHKIVSSNDEADRVSFMNDLQEKVESIGIADRSRLNLEVIKKISGLLVNENYYIRSSAARSLGEIGRAACSEKSSLEKALYDEEHPSGVFKIFPSHGNEGVFSEAISKMHCS